MSRIGKLPIAVPSGVDVAIDEQPGDRQGPQGHPVAHRGRSDHRREGRGRRPRGQASRRRAREPLAARPDPHADQQHGRRRDRRLREEARDRGRGLPRPVQGPDPAGVPARLLATRSSSTPPRASPSPSRARPGSASRASTSSSSARWPPRSASCASPSPTRARAFATPASTSAARSERLVSDHGDLAEATTSTPRPASSRACAARSGAARRSPAPPSVRAWSSPGRASTSPCRSSTTWSARRWPTPPPWRPTCASFEGDKTAKAKKVGELVAERAKAAGIDGVVFDRAGNKYHGRIAALADGAREGGLTF